LLFLHLNDTKIIFLKYYFVMYKDKTPEAL